MSNIPAILAQGIENLPNNSGPAYERGSKLGSWVTSGEQAYINALEEWDEYQHLLSKVGDPNDTTRRLMIENALATGRNVKVLRGLSQAQIQRMNQILQKAKSAPPVRMKDAKAMSGGTLMNSGSKTIVTDTAGSYNSFTDPYNDLGSLTANNPQQVIEQLSRAGYKIGYEYIRGFEMGSNAKWDIKLRPYRSSVAGRYTVTPELPKYSLVTKDGTNDFSFGEQCPILNWTLNIGQIDSSPVNLFGGSSMQVPSKFNFNMMLSVTILDDVYRSMDNYIKEYTNKIYSTKDACMAPYWAMAFSIPFTLFRPNYAIAMKCKFIGIPYNYSIDYSSSQPTDENSVQLQFSIIGLEKGRENARVYKGGLKGHNKRSLTWKDITLTQN